MQTQTITKNGPLSPRQMDALEVLRKFIAEHHYPPTLDEIGKSLGITKVSAFDLTRALAKKGYIILEARNYRSIRLVEKCPTCGHEPTSREPITRIAQ